MKGAKWGREGDGAWRRKVRKGEQEQVQGREQGEESCKKGAVMGMGARGRKIQNGYREQDGSKENKVK